MEIIVNINPGNEMGTSLFNTISRNTAVKPTATYGLESFFTLMNSKISNEVVAVFLISSVEELDQIADHPLYLKNSKYIFILADHDQPLINKALSLHPRYISYAQDGFGDVSAVLNKMLRKFEDIV